MEIRDEEIREFIAALAGSSKYDFNDYSEKSFRRRMEKLVNDNHCSLADLMKKMKANPALLEKIVIDITVNTTEIFRDPKVWIELRDEIIPSFKNQDEIHVWHAGSSSGQEVYSFLMLMNELGLMEKTHSIGTDLNTDMLEEARKGVYKYRFIAEYLPNFDLVLNSDPSVPKIPYNKYMDIDEGRDTLKMKPFLTAKPTYQKHDLVKEGNNFGKQFDLILCRNVLIYFNNNLQNKVFEMFWQSLKPNGYLVIGLHESIMGPASVKFLKKNQHYRKINPEQ
jgi:chemotaxis protein methyltransferase CheR